jgi:FixJ family two-component response regulator
MEKPASQQLSSGRPRQEGPLPAGGADRSNAGTRGESGSAFLGLTESISLPPDANSVVDGVTQEADITDIGFPVAVASDDQAVVSQVRQEIRAAGYAALDWGRASGLRSGASRMRIACGVVAWAGPNWDGGIQLVKELAGTDHSLPVVMIGRPDSVDLVVAAMRAGARDYLPRPYAPSDLVASIRRQTARNVLSGVPLRDAALFDALSLRECEVLDQVLRGYSTKQIAIELGKVEKTIEYHRKRIMEKLGASNIVQVVRMATLCRWQLPTSRLLQRAEDDPVSPEIRVYPNELG